jgi:uncharacterized protein YwgA
MNDLRRDYALLAHVTERANRGEKVGKKALQKMVHLLTRIAHIDSRYEFSLYTYGPFSRDLAEDMDLLSASNVLSVNYDASSRGYEITKGIDADKIISQFEGFISELDAKTDSLFEFFSGKSARSLEMYSTLFFVVDHGLVEDVEDDRSVVSKFLEIKPKYTRVEASSALVSLRELLKKHPLN